MPLDRLNDVLARHVATLEEAGTAKGAETVVVEVIPPAGKRGPRFRLEGAGDREFIRMNSNSYLGLSLVPAIMNAEEEATARWGAGPGAVRFISGTYEPHLALEKRLAAFHGRDAAMIFSSAYATVLSTIVPLTTEQTVLISDELNHNCIINAMRLARPADKFVYRHNDVADLQRALEEASGKVRSKGLSDDEDDRSLPIYAARYPVIQVIGAAEPCPQLPADMPVPPGLAGFTAGRRLDEVMLESHRITFGGE